MKKKNTVLLLGITSILILISVQVFIIIGVWKQKNEMFTLRYTMRSQEGLGYIRFVERVDPFDTVKVLLEGYSDTIVHNLFRVQDTVKLEKRKKEVLNYFREVIMQEEDLSLLLSAYFESENLEKNFKSSIRINNIELFNFDTTNTGQGIVGIDTMVIYRGERQSWRPRSERSGLSLLTKDPDASIHVYRFNSEGNHYRISIDYYIDFSDKKQVVLRETSASLGLSVLSILIVGIMFLITYRNLMEEKRLSNLKTDFINNMTHELKTPLSTITVAGKTLEMPQIRSNDEKILETAKLIGKQSVHLNQLINMILEISMWERTQFELEKRNVNIEEIMKDVVDSFKSGGGQNAIINEKYNFTGAKVDMDVVYFTTLLNNLLSNAVKYSDKKPEIEIEGFKAENNICIKVTDNGIGINRMDQKHIFDKFYRASSGNIHKFKGLGLGLYYVKKIAEAHGGDVSVSSKPGKGSTFTVTLPGFD
jgi:signal transduction histidine kinase